MKRLPKLNKIFVILLTSSVADAQTPVAERFTLKQFQELAEQNGNQLGEERAKVEFSEARVDFADAKGLPSAKIEAFFAEGPGAQGNALVGSTEWDHWGPIVSSKVELAQPLYTFGAISAGKKAARAGLQAEKNLLERDRWVLRTQVTEFYYGYQLAFELSEIAGDVGAKLNQALSKGEASKKRKADDLDKLRLYIAEVQVRSGEAQKGLDQARMGMAWKIGTYSRSLPKWDQANLVEHSIELKDLTEYQKIAREHRPELKALQQEVEARTALVEVEKSLRYPMIFVGGRVEYAVAPNRDDQHSPFAYDPANQLSAGIGLGLKWDLGIFEGNAKVGQVRAELRQAEGKSRHLSDGIFAEVEKVYLDLRQAKEALKVRGESSKISKRLYNDSLAQWGLGVGEPKSLLENLGAYTMAEKARLEAIYNVNVLTAKFEQAVGNVLQ